MKPQVPEECGYWLKLKKECELGSCNLKPLVKCCLVCESLDECLLENLYSHVLK